jgi:hypothetical protein
VSHLCVHLVDVIICHINRYVLIISLLCRVNGFDHSPLDERQSDWHSHWFPYKMGCYKKTLLAEPVCIAVLDYASEATDEAGVLLSPIVSMPATVTSGRCDCVVLWVDYVISDDNVLQFWDGSDFPPYVKTSVKFFGLPIEVGVNSVIQCKSSFSYGDSEIEIFVEST